MSESEATSSQSSIQSGEDKMSKKRVLLSSIGSRGDVQPLLALGCELRDLDCDIVICVPPNFKEWVESFGFEFVPIGVDVQKAGSFSAAKKKTKPARADMKKLMHFTVVNQFHSMSEAVRTCDLIVAAGDLNHAARSLAEVNNIPFIHAVYCPVSLESSAYPPPTLTWANHLYNLPRWCNCVLWMLAKRRWNGLFGAALNEQRELLNLPPIEDVPAYIRTSRPWLAFDSALAPVQKIPGVELVQAGAWLLPNSEPLPAALEAFLAEGEAPIYFGYGSMRAGSGTGRIMVEAARKLGYRAVLLKGWAGLEIEDSDKDCIVVDNVNHEQLFPRVAAIVHHGGAGTTTAAARAGKPQVIVPHLYDQFYWGHRVRQLGIGDMLGKINALTSEKLIAALRCCLQGNVVERAKIFASNISQDGARVAAQHCKQLLADVTQSNAIIT